MRPRMQLPIAALTLGAMTARAHGQAPGQARTPVPLCPGLVVVTAVQQPQGDYESIKRIERVSTEGVRIRYSSYMKDPKGDYESTTTPPPPWVPFSVFRNVRSADLDTAMSYLQQFPPEGAPETVKGTTALGVSRRALRDLEAGKPVKFTVYQTILPGAGIKDDGTPVMFGMDSRLPGGMKLAEPNYVSIPVLVNDRPRMLRAVHAYGKFLWDEGDLYFLDDPSNPLALRYTLGKSHLDVVKISYACADPPPPNGAATQSGATSAAAELERTLAETGRAEIFSIYFSFNRDVIRDESEPTLATIAAILRKHPTWHLSIEGHTDNIGSAAANLDLSKRRSAAVKDALVKAFRVDGARLTTTGYGATRPRDTNATLEGRARNRRVELVRS